MTYNDTFIKGVTYGKAEELWDTARTDGFIAFLEEFKTLANKYAEVQLEEFIDDHFPEDKISQSITVGKEFFDYLGSDKIKQYDTTDLSPEWLEQILEKVRKAHPL